MSLYYHMLIEDAPEGFSLGKRVNVDGTKFLFSSSQYETLENEDKINATPFPHNKLQELRDFINTEGSDWTPLPTEQELEQRVMSSIKSKYQRIDREVTAARQRVGSDLPFQTKAYELKLQEANGWDGVNDVPDSIQTVADRFEITAIDAKSLIIQKAAEFIDKLGHTEKLREQGYTFAKEGNISSYEIIISELKAIR